MPSDATAFITEPLLDVASWAACFDAAWLPVLASTADSLEDLRANEDAVDAHLLADALASDPLMTLKLLAHVAGLQKRRDSGDVETVTEALVMLGITPFFRTFASQNTVEQVLATDATALSGFRRVLRRSRRAADFAIAFAVHRMDPDAHVIHGAALLHDFAELLLWLRAPALASDVARRQQDQAGLRSDAAQREVLHVALNDLQHTLMTAWHLPPLLVRITDHHGEAVDPQVRNVLLAIRVARHSAEGWDNPALPDDVREIGALLQLGDGPALRLLREIDAD